MTSCDPFESRLAALRSSGRPELAPLWIEHLLRDDALAELAGREGAVFRLQESWFLLEAGQADDGRAVLDLLADLPPGLEDLKRELLGRVDTRELAVVQQPDVAPAGMASKTLAELYASQGDLGTAISIYRELVNRDPADSGAKERLQKLLGEESSGVEGLLLDWLDRVRLWRGALGV
jgi:hypothetical protein